MGMCAIYQEVKEEDFKKLLESDDFFETIEELEEKDGTELCDIDKMWDALHFLLNGLSAIHGIPEDNILSEFIIGSENFNDEAEEFARYIPTERVIEIAKKYEEKDITEEDYNSDIEEIVKILKGGTGELIKHYKLLMEESSENLEFEKAQKIKEEIAAIEMFSERQIARDMVDGDVDACVILEKYNQIFVGLTSVRDGKIIGVFRSSVDAK